MSVIEVQSRLTSLLDVLEHERGALEDGGDGRLDETLRAMKPSGRSSISKQRSVASLESLPDWHGRRQSSSGLARPEIPAYATHWKVAQITVAAPSPSAEHATIAVLARSSSPDIASTMKDGKISSPNRGSEVSGKPPVPAGKVRGSRECDDCENSVCGSEPSPDKGQESKRECEEDGVLDVHREEVRLGEVVGVVAEYDDAVPDATERPLGRGGAVPCGLSVEKADGTSGLEPEHHREGGEQDQRQNQPREPPRARPCEHGETGNHGDPGRPCKEGAASGTGRDRPAVSLGSEERGEGEREQERLRVARSQEQRHRKDRETKDGPRRGVRADASVGESPQELERHEARDERDEHAGERKVAERTTEPGDEAGIEWEERR
jgi:hypothetical protein